MGADGFILQKVVTIQGPQASIKTRVTQSESEWFDAGDRPSVELRIGVYALSDCELHIQTSPIRDSSPGEAYSATGYTIPGYGQWRVAKVINATGSTNFLLNVAGSFGGTPAPLDRFIRWQVVSKDSPTGDWIACFWIALVAKA